MTQVHVEIDRLVLTGWPLGPREAGQVQAAVEAELGRLLSGDGARALPGGAADRMTAGPVAWPAAGGAAGLGSEVAQAVYGTLGGGPVR